MSNIKKTIIYTTIYNIGFMFCSGAILQTFLLQIGFSENQVYLCNTIIQFSQVAIMVLMIFISNKIKNVKLTSSISYLSLVVLSAVFLMGAINKELILNTYVIIVFIVAGITNLGVGLFTVLSYILPFYTIKMEDYGKMAGLGVMFSGGCSFIFSFIHTLIVSKFDYMQSMAWFFLLAIICFVITSIVCLSLKSNEQVGENKNNGNKDDTIQVFKNKDTYLLLLPNFARGISTGIMNVIAVVAISVNILNEQTSSLITLFLQIAMFIGNFIYIISYKKFSSKFLLIVSTICVCIALSLCLNGDMIWFLVFFFISSLARMISDTAIPVIIAEIIPQKQIGAYTSIRMLVFTGAQAVATIIIQPIINVVNYSGLMIFAAVMQAICGVGYYVCAQSKTKKNTATINNKF